MLAVSLGKYELSPAREFTEQVGEACLQTWVEMNLGLLREHQARAALRQLDDKRKNLRASEPSVGDVDWWPSAAVKTQRN